MTHIFISYSKKDIAFARHLKQQLERQGFGVWLDESRLVPSTRWWPTIETNINTCAAFLIIMSLHSKESDWVEREILHAERLRKPIFPVLLAGEGWSRLGNIEYADMRGGIYASLPDRLLDGLRTHAPTGPNRGPVPPPLDLKPPSKRGRFRGRGRRRGLRWVRRLVLLAAAAVAVVIAVFAAQEVLAPGESGSQAVTVVEPCYWRDQGAGLCLYTDDSGTPDRILTDREWHIEGATWSPDGKRIAFAALKPGESSTNGFDIYIINADGSDLTELPTSGNSISPGWSPDGEWLAFHYRCDLGVMRPDGSGLRVLWQHEESQCVAVPEWSPDSQRIAFSTQQGDSWMDRAVLVLDRTQAQNRVTEIVNVHYRRECPFDLTQVAFSPDGTQVAYIGRVCDVYMIEADGGDSQPLSEFPVGWSSRAYPRWQDSGDK